VYVPYGSLSFPTSESPFSSLFRGKDGLSHACSEFASSHGCFSVPLTTPGDHYSLFYSLLPGTLAYYLLQMMLLPLWVSAKR
jgi:hypothetical protein